MKTGQILVSLTRTEYIVRHNAALKGSVHLIMMTNYPVSKRLLIVAALIINLLAACTVYDDAADTAETVDDAVKLLQDIEQRGTWGVIDDRLVTLNDQGVGYQAQVTIQTSVPDEPAAELTLTVVVDRDNNARLQLVGSEAAGDYLILGYELEAAARPTYQITDDGYTCLTGDQIPGILRTGIDSIFATYAIQAVGMQVLSVVERTDDEVTIADRTAIHYELDSRLDEAAHILSQLENDALRDAVEAAGQFDMTGNLYLDEDTLALLGFDMRYEQLDTQQRLDFSFMITQWDDVPAHAVPAESDVIVGCS